MPQTAAEVLAKKLEAEVKRLSPQAVVRSDYSNYQDDGVDVYVYAPRRVSDMLRTRLKTTLMQELKRLKGIKAQLLVEDIESMTPEAKAKYGIPK